MPDRYGAAGTRLPKGEQGSLDDGDHVRALLHGQV
jgi:hypothetical protein